MKKEEKMPLDRFEKAQYIGAGICITVLLVYAILPAAKKTPPRTEAAIENTKGAATNQVPGDFVKSQTVKPGMTNYGNGVLYFPLEGREFALSLSIFLYKHTNLEVTAMAPNVVRRVNNQNVELNDASSYYDYGAAVGYFVTVRDKH